MPFLLEQVSILFDDPLNLRQLAAAEAARLR
jgi:hypothetical protein